jgi:uncharacterized membrane protein YecN with MAPEG domain
MDEGPLTNGTSHWRQRPVRGDCPAPTKAQPRRRRGPFPAVVPPAHPGKLPQQVLRTNVTNVKPLTAILLTFASMFTRDTRRIVPSNARNAQHGLLKKVISTSTSRVCTSKSVTSNARTAPPVFLSTTAFRDTSGWCTHNCGLLFAANAVLHSSSLLIAKNIRTQCT